MCFALQLLPFCSSRGGENYYVQVDSHLQFAKGWDELYINDLHLARAFPNAILSTYPPGFINFRQEPPYTRGTRICNCHFSQGEGNILRVEMNGRCKENETRPTQMPFAGAGFVFAHSQVRSVQTCNSWHRTMHSYPESFPLTRTQFYLYSCFVMCRTIPICHGVSWVKKSHTVSGHGRLDGTSTLQDSIW